MHKCITNCELQISLRLVWIQFERFMELKKRKKRNATILTENVQCSSAAMLTQIQFSWQFTIRYCVHNVQTANSTELQCFNSIRHTEYWNHSKAFRTMAFNHKNVIAVKLCFVLQLNSNCYKSMLEFTWLNGNHEQWEKDCRSLFGTNPILLFELVLQQRVESNKVQHELCYSNDLLLFIVFLYANFVSFHRFKQFRILSYYYCVFLLWGF